jgi:hypothetical protein
VPRLPELPSDRRRFMDRLNWEDFQEHRDAFPVGTLLAVLTVVLTIMAIFLSSQGESRTGDDLRWGFFILLVLILCIVAIRWLYPKRLRFDEMDYREDLGDGEPKHGIDRTTAEGALEGKLFNQVNMMLQLREALANRVMARNHLSRPGLQTVIEEKRLAPLVKDTDLAWILNGTARKFEELLRDESNGIRANFYVWFEDMLRKVEEWQ